MDGIPVGRLQEMIEDLDEQVTELERLQEIIEGLAGRFTQETERAVSEVLPLQLTISMN